MGFGTGSTSVIVLCPNWDNLAQLGIFPDYTAPVTGATATSSSPVGSYPITCSGAVDPNYTIGYTAGTLNVTYQVKALYNRTTINNSGTSVPIKLPRSPRSGARGARRRAECATATRPADAIVVRTACGLPLPGRR